MPKLGRDFETFILGTAVKITTNISVATEDSCTITIDDSTETAKVSSANMTKAADNYYTYIFQTTSTWNDGEYVATITVTSGGYTSIAQYKFTMIEQESD